MSLDHYSSAEFFLFLTQYLSNDAVFISTWLFLLDPIIWLFIKILCMALRKSPKCDIEITANDTCREPLPKWCLIIGLIIHAFDKWAFRHLMTWYENGFSLFWVFLRLPLLSLVLVIAEATLLKSGSERVDKLVTMYV